MRRLYVSPAARADIAAITAKSLEAFGADAAITYNRLIRRAFEDLLDDPCRTGSAALNLSEGSYRLYAIRHSVERAPRVARVRKPRHVVIFRADDERLEVVRVLHDAMDPQRHLL